MKHDHADGGPEQKALSPTETKEVDVGVTSASSSRWFSRRKRETAVQDKDLSPEPANLVVLNDPCSAGIEFESVVHDQSGPDEVQRVPVEREHGSTDEVALGKDSAMDRNEPDDFKETSDPALLGSDYTSLQQLVGMAEIFADSEPNESSVNSLIPVVLNVSCSEQVNLDESSLRKGVDLPESHDSSQDNEGPTLEEDSDPGLNESAVGVTESAEPANIVGLDDPSSARSEFESVIHGQDGPDKVERGPDEMGEGITEQAALGNDSALDGNESDDVKASSDPTLLGSDSTSFLHCVGSAQSFGDLEPNKCALNSSNSAVLNMSGSEQLDEVFHGQIEPLMVENKSDGVVASFQDGNMVDISSEKSGEHLSCRSQQTDSQQDDFGKAVKGLTEMAESKGGQADAGNAREPENFEEASADEPSIKTVSGFELHESFAVANVNLVVDEEFDVEPSVPAGSLVVADLDRNESGVFSELAAVLNEDFGFEPSLPAVIEIDSPSSGQVASDDAIKDQVEPEKAEEYEATKRSIDTEAGSTKKSGTKNKDGSDSKKSAVSPVAAADLPTEFNNSYSKQVESTAVVADRASHDQMGNYSLNEPSSDVYSLEPKVYAVSQGKTVASTQGGSSIAEECELESIVVGQQPINDQKNVQAENPVSTLNPDTELLCHVASVAICDGIKPTGAFQNAMAPQPRASRKLNIPSAFSRASKVASGGMTANVPGLKQKKLTIPSAFARNELVNKPNGRSITSGEQKNQHSEANRLELSADDQLHTRAAKSKFVTRNREKSNTSKLDESESYTICSNAESATVPAQHRADSSNENTAPAFPERRKSKLHIPSAFSRPEANTVDQGYSSSAKSVALTVEKGIAGASEFDQLESGNLLSSLESTTEQATVQHSLDASDDKTAHLAPMTRNSKLPIPSAFGGGQISVTARALRERSKTGMDSGPSAIRPKQRKLAIPAAFGSGAPKTTLALQIDLRKTEAKVPSFSNSTSCDNNIVDVAIQVDTRVDTKPLADPSNATLAESSIVDSIAKKNFGIPPKHIQPKLPAIGKNATVGATTITSTLLKKNLVIPSAFDGSPKIQVASKLEVDTKARAMSTTFVSSHTNLLGIKDTDKNACTTVPMVVDALDEQQDNNDDMGINSKNQNTGLETSGTPDTVRKTKVAIPAIFANAPSRSAEVKKPLARPRPKKKLVIPSAFGG